MDIGSVDIAALSVAMKSAQTAQQVDVAVMKNVMDSQEVIADALIEMMTQVNVSGASGHVDISV
ncbi:YjfB family protein [Christensenellaceae bacterium OttesenSCG-928-K19]|nr:YjfB family protein [Christensenellaceae bacterium OttesenSCG-928-K19]